MKAAARNSWGMTVLIAGVTLCATLQAAAQAAYRYDAATVSGLPARNIGSATMSGRIAALDAVEEDGSNPQPAVGLVGRAGLPGALARGQA